MHNHESVGGLGRLRWRCDLNPNSTVRHAFSITGSYLSIITLPWNSTQHAEPAAPAHIINMYLFQLRLE